MSLCLVTYLKGVVDDDTLEKVGVLKLKFKISSSSQKGLRLYLFAPCTLTMSQSVDIYLDDSIVETGESYTVEAEGNYYLKPLTLNSDVTVDITNKSTAIRWVGISSPKECDDIVVINGDNSLSNLTSFSATGGSVFDLDMFKSSVLENLYIQEGAKTTGSLRSLARSNARVLCIWQQDGSGITGELSDMVSAMNSSDAINFSLRNAERVTGSIDDIVTLKDLHNLELAGCTGITGAIESYLEYWYSGNWDNLNLILPRNVTMNGLPLNSIGWVGSVSKSNGILTIKDSMNNVKAIYNGSVWSYTQ